MKVFKKITNILGFLVSRITGILIVVMFAILLWQVFCRYVLKNSTGWTNELSMFLFFWCCMLGAAWAVKSGGHMAMTMLANKFKGVAGYVVRIIIVLISEVFFAVLISSGFKMTSKFAHTSTPLLKISNAYIYCAFIVSGILMALFGLEKLIDLIIECVHYKKKTGKDGKVSCQ